VLGLAGERMKDSSRPEGILKLAEETRHTSMVMSSVGGIVSKRRVWRTLKLGVDCHRSELCVCEVSKPTGNQIIQIIRKEREEEWVFETMEYYWQRFGVSSNHPEIFWLG